MHDIDLQAFTVAGIAHHCARETERFFQRLAYDPHYCFELFRRAIVEGSQQAWELVYLQYRPLATGWVKSHPAFPDSGEEVQYLLNRAFERMWSVLTPEKFRCFADLKSVLRYLQMCVHSAVVDEARKVSLPVADVEDEALPAADVRPTAGSDGQVDRRQFWSQIGARLHDDQERCVVYGSYVLGLKPRELVEHYPRIFCDVQAVYRVKENVLDRLRRDPALQGW